MKAKILTVLISAIISFAFTLPPSLSSLVAGKTWYFHSISNDHIELKLSKPDANGTGSFSWTAGINIIDKREGKYTLKNNILTLNYYWAGVKTVTHTYRIEHETKTGFLLVEQRPGVNDKVRSFLFTSSE